MSPLPAALPDSRGFRIGKTRIEELREDDTAFLHFLQLDLTPAGGVANNHLVVLERSLRSPDLSVSDGRGQRRSASLRHQFHFHIHCWVEVCGVRNDMFLLHLHSRTNSQQAQEHLSSFPRQLAVHHPPPRVWPASTVRVSPVTRSLPLIRPTIASATSSGLQAACRGASASFAATKAS